MYISIINPTVDRGAQEFNPSSNPQAIGWNYHAVVALKGGVNGMK